MEGVSPQEAFAELSANPDALTILYTGNTQGNLEPCGCYVGQSGGVARRATVVERFRKKGIPLLLVDAGEPESGDSEPSVSLGAIHYASLERTPEQSEGTELDRLKGETYRTATALMGYAEVASSTVVTVGTQRVALVRAAPGDSPETVREQIVSLRSQADCVVLLSAIPAESEERLAKEGGIDLLISASKRNSEIIGKTQWVGSTPQGTMLGYAQREHGTNWKAGSITLTEETPEHPAVKTLLTAFYAKVAADPKFQHPTTRLFEKETLERDPGNGYAGAEACQSCHEDEYSQWEMTAHAAAYHTLLKNQRHFYPDCVSCHVTGFGYETGFRVGQEERKHLVGVQCETCHGPGKEHVSNPKKENTRKRVETALCQQCHNDEHHPGFAKVAEHLRPKVNHSESVRNIRELLAQRSKLPGKTTVALVVVSMCPYGVKAEQALIPVFRDFEGELDVRLHFIGSEKKDAPGQFESMHGVAELEENMRQAVMAKYEPDKLYDYLLRAKTLKGSWEESARKVGMDTGKIQRVVKSPEAVELYRANIRRSQELKAYGSPTLYVNGTQIRNALFAKGGNKGAVCGP